MDNKIIYKHDGYNIYKINKKNCKALKKKFNKLANKEFNNFKSTGLSQQGTIIIPSNHNTYLTNSRINLELAIDNDCLIGIQINDENDTSYYDDDYENIANILLQNKVIADYNKKKNMFLCEKTSENLDKIKKVFYSYILKKREQNIIDIIEHDGFLEKDIEKEEGRFYKNLVIDEIEQNIYKSEIELAADFLYSTDPSVKIIMSNKHKKNIILLLTLLNIPFIQVENNILVSKKQLPFIKSNIQKYIAENALPQNTLKTINENKLDITIDEVIQEVKNKNREDEIKENIIEEARER